MVFSWSPRKFVVRNIKFQQKLEQILHDQKHADTVFLVNQSTFLASSLLVSIHSDVLHELIKEYSENCGDREIRIKSVRYGFSFQILLKYMHNVDIHFTDLGVEFLCECLFLCKRFQVVDLLEELKHYIANLTDFQIDQVVVLLNTAKEFGMQDLYKQLFEFTCRNAQEIVKCESFQEMEYNVLVELLETDWFHAEEKDIFLGTLKWHSYHMNLENLNEYYENFESIERENSIEVHSTDSSTESYADPSSNDKKENTMICETFKAEDTRSLNTVNIPEGVTKFAENVLRKTMTHIRLNEMTSEEYRIILQQYNYKPYDKVLTENLYSQSKRRYQLQNHWKDFLKICLPVSGIFLIIYLLPMTTLGSWIPWLPKRHPEFDSFSMGYLSPTNPSTIPMNQWISMPEREWLPWTDILDYLHRLSLV